MLALPLKIKSCSDENLLIDYISNYTGVYYKLYNNPELLCDKVTKKELTKSTDKFIYDSCVSDVKTKLNQHETSIKKKNERIKQIEYILDKELYENKKAKYKLLNTLYELKRNLNKNICFGGKKMLRDIQKVQHKLHKNLKYNNLTEKEVKDLEDRLEKLKQEFKENRRIPLYVIGQANQKGNRKFNFDLVNNKIIFKPKKGVKIEFEIYVGKNQRKILDKLQYLSDIKDISLTVRLKDNDIYLIYDNEKVNGFNFYWKLYDDLIQKYKPKTKEEKSFVFKECIKEQNDRKLAGKISKRSLSFDLNPHFIGFTIIDEIENNDVVGGPKIIYGEIIKLSNISKKLNVSSSNKKQSRQNNKRKHEIKEIWNYIFRIATHYKCANCCFEDFDFKIDNKEVKSKEFNRLTKNIWHRTLTKQCIEKHCENLGIIQCKANPIYTSFIGNMIYDLPDPLAASIIIWYRGVGRYRKGFQLYPDIDLIKHEKLVYLGVENDLVVSEMSWKQLYNKIAKLRYRNQIPSGFGLDKNLFSHKSNITKVTFDDICV